MKDTLLIGLSREITIEKDGRKSAVVAVEQIYHRPEKNDWVCLWKVDYLCTRGIAIGADALEALTNAIRALELLIEGSEKDGYKIWWKAPGDLAGFSSAD
jgi:hypothetical protein